MKFWTFRVLLLLVLSSLSLSAFAQSNEDDESDAEAEKIEKRLQDFSKKATPSQLMKKINGGWTKSYQKAIEQLHPKRSYVVLHVWDPKNTLDLRTADGFRATLTSIGLLNVSKIDIGHTWIAWRCQTPQGIVEGAAGQTGENEEQTAKMLKSGWGLSAFKARFNDGYLQTPELIENSVLTSDEHENLNILFMEVDDAVCQRTMNFVRDYVHHPSQPRKIFGLEPNPAKFEGGGCGSFGITAAEVGGVFGSQRISSHFWRNLKAKRAMFGIGTERPPYTLFYEPKGAGKVPLFSPYMVGKDVLFTDWTGKDENDPSLRILDPELLLIFVRKIYRDRYSDLYKSNSDIAGSFLTTKNKQFAYRLFEADMIAETPAMRDRRLKGGKGSVNTVVFDGSLDDQAERVVSGTVHWLRTNKYRASFTKVGSHTGVILRRP